MLQKLSTSSSGSAGRTSRSTGRVAQRPNMSSKGVKRVESCREVLNAKTHVSRKELHWVFFEFTNFASIRCNV